MLTDEMRYKLMRILQESPEMSQRALAKELGVSLGKVNFCLQALVKKGLVKAKNFGRSHNKTAYIYLLTPRGVEQKSSLTLRFLNAKLKEYEALHAEIEQIKRDVKEFGKR
jgi:EPS-associated MarR family transcriptional regulator